MLLRILERFHGFQLGHESWIALLKLADYVVVLEVALETLKLVADCIVCET